jgi:uncharacterized membrane protein YqjE
LRFGGQCIDGCFEAAGSGICLSLNRVACAAAMSPTREICMSNSSVETEPERRGASQLVNDLSSQVSNLVRLEVALAKAEMSEKGKEVALAAAMLAVAAIAGLLMVGSLTAFLIILLASWLPGWAGALIVTAGWTLVAGLSGLLGRRRVGQVGAPIPEQTIETLKEDVRWLKSRN